RGAARSGALRARPPVRHRAARSPSRATPGRVRPRAAGRYARPGEPRALAAAPRNPARASLKRHLFALLACLSCARQGREAQPPGPVTIVLEHQPLWGDPAAFHASLERFQRDNPDVVVRTQTLP